MRYIVILSLHLFSVTSFCQSKPDNEELAVFFKQYSEYNTRLFPLRAVYAGDYRFNDHMPVTFTDSYNERSKQFYTSCLDGLRQFNRNGLNENDRISYDILKYNLETALEGLQYNENRAPFNQMGGVPIQMGQLGSGTSAQPFKTVKDYEDWIIRAKMLDVWADSAIIYFRKGITENNVLPKALVVKMIPQLRDLQKKEISQSVFYGPVNNFPSSFSEPDKVKLREAYKQLISQYINPSYKKLETFLTQEYLPKARTSSGIGNATANGHKRYNYWIRVYTTTHASAEEIYHTGLSEVARIRIEMEKVRHEVKYKGPLDSFFVYTKTAPQFLPYTTAEQVLDDYRSIEKKIEPNLSRLFSLRPRTAFEVRQTESFRAASAAAEYQRGLPDGTRPGIFYVPILDPAKYTVARESLFLHEAIPGHHFQIMIQKENVRLPQFRQDGGGSVYAEGWALYCESLGKLLGCYTDPYQYFYALGDEMHRAIRLVVDAGIHSKGWSREQAVKYMQDNEPITEQRAVAEIERYMAWPGQALSYKTGELKIKELRDKYMKLLGNKFTLSAFHDALIKDGNMPLSVLESKMDVWAAEMKNNNEVHQATAN